MFFIEVIKGAKAHLDKTYGIYNKTKLLTRFAFIIAIETIGTFGMFNYGMHALCVRHKIQFGGKRKRHEIKASISYGKKPRNKMDIYLPDDIKERKNKPVFLYCHGGVWSQGERWHYAPMAAQLAQEGITTCIMSYSLYPDVMASEMSDEVNTAIDWVNENLVEYTGGLGKVSLGGHSAGAQLCMMALIKRALASKKMPDLFVGIAGVYDITNHYEYERKRGVHEMSTMKRAVGGKKKFSEESPAILLKALKPILENKIKKDNNQFKTFPKTTLLSSINDKTVPSFQSEYLKNRMLEHDLDVEHICYMDIGHADFVTTLWKNNIEDYKHKKNSESAQIIFDILASLK